MSRRRRSHRSRLGLLAFGAFGVAGVFAGSRAQAAPPEFDPAKELLRVAKMRQDENVLARFAEARGRVAPDVTEKELAEIVDVIERAGYPDRALRLLEQRVRAFPKETHAWVALAKLYGRANDTKSAVRTWQQIKERFGLTLDESVTYARALSHVGDQAGALKALRDAQDKAGDGAEVFWGDLAHLAWQQDDSATALTAYRKLFAAKALPPGASARLLRLLSDAEQLDEAIAVAKGMYRLEKDAGHLLFAAELQVRKKYYAGAKKTLDALAAMRAIVTTTFMYWVLRAEVAGHLGDKESERLAFRRASFIDPSAASVRAALLWDSIERGDVNTLRDDLRAWLPGAAEQKEMWAPVAIGLARVGRPREALPFYLRQMRETPNDASWMLELADASDRAGVGGASAMLRKRAFAKLRAEARRMQSEPPDKRDAKILAAHARLVRDVRGEPEAEWWLRRALAVGVRSPELEELAVGWYLSEGASERARRHLNRARTLKMARSTMRSLELSMAVAERDVDTIERIADDANTAGEPVDDRELAAALAEVERDDLAVAPIRRVLFASEGEAASSPEVDKLPRELRATHDETAPTASGGVSTSYVNALAVDEVTASVSHRLGGGRIIYSASAMRLVDLDGAAVAFGLRNEFEAGVTGRWSTARRFTELGLGANYLTETAPDLPVPRASYNDVVQLSRGVTLLGEVGVDKRIEDTSFLRVVGLRDVASVRALIDPLSRVYTRTTLLAHEDHTRSFKWVGAEVGGSIEAGYKLLQHLPEWTVSVQAGAFERTNRSDLPSEYRDLVLTDLRKSLEVLYPPSYQLLVFRTQLVRGDFFERAHKDRLPFPHYDCSAEIGAVFAPTASGGTAAAGAARCAASVKVPTNGYLSAVGEYIRGLTGVSGAENGRVGLAYTQYLR